MSDGDTGWVNDSGVQVGGIRPKYELRGGLSPTAEHEWGKTPVAECSHTLWSSDGFCQHCKLSAKAVVTALTNLCGYAGANTMAMPIHDDDISGAPIRLWRKADELGLTMRWDA